MKTCKKIGCTYPVFGGGFCKGHQYLRKDKPPKRIGASPKRKYGQLDLFYEIWDKTWEDGCHKCWLTKQELYYPTGTPLWLSCFAHILPKGKYPEFLLREDNILILSPYVHHIFDKPTLEEIFYIEKKLNCNFDLLFQKADKLREEYIMLTGKKRLQRKIVLKYREYKKNRCVI